MVAQGLAQFFDPGGNVFRHLEYHSSLNFESRSEALRETVVMGEKVALATALCGERSRRHVLPLFQFHPLTGDGRGAYAVTVTAREVNLEDCRPSAGMPEPNAAKSPHVTDCFRRAFFLVVTDHQSVRYTGLGA